MRTDSFGKFIWPTILLVGLALWLIPSSTTAHAPGVSLTGVGTATIDAVISAGEWDNAGTATFDVNVIGGGTTPGTLFVMNDASNLYLAIRYGTVGQINNANFTFDNNHSGETRFENGDDVLLHNGSRFIDAFRTNEPPCPPNRPPGNCGFLDETFGGTTDGSAAFSNAGGVTIYEFSHPLDSSDDTHDISLGSGDTVGFVLRISMFDIGIPTGDTVFPGGIESGDIVVAPSVLPADIDIKPGSEPNSLNLNGNGVVPVGLFGAVDLDVKDIDVTTLLFGLNGDDAAPVHRGHVEDLNNDGLDDLVLHFREGDLGVPVNSAGNTSLTLTLTGKLDDGTAFEGEDDVRITPNNSKSRGKGGKGPK